MAGRVIEEVKFQLTGSVMLYGLEIASNVVYGVTKSGSYFLHYIDEFGRQNRLGDEEKALASPLVAVLPVGRLFGPGFTE